MGDIRLSVILNHAGRFETIRNTIRHVARQTALEQLELVIVCTERNAGDLDVGELAAIPHWRLVVIPKLAYGAIGWSAGARSAVGEAVVLAEDHSYPEPNWAATLIEGHEKGYTVVAPELKNGNPGTKVSWANFQLTFIEWFLPDGSGEVRRGPGHNSSYLKSALLGMEGDLADWLVSEAVLHDVLKQRGHGIYLDARTSTRHLNLSKPMAFLRHSFLGGRIFGNVRRQGWTLGKRWVYALGFPLVPLVRLKRLFELLDTPEKRAAARLYEALPWTMLGLLCHAAGEATGYVAGGGGAMLEYQGFETRRIDYLIDSERSLLLD